MSEELYTVQLSLTKDQLIELYADLKTVVDIKKSGLEQTKRTNPMAVLMEALSGKKPEKMEVDPIEERKELLDRRISEGQLQSTTATLKAICENPFIKNELRPYWRERKKLRAVYSAAEPWSDAEKLAFETLSDFQMSRYELTPYLDAQREMSELDRQQYLSRWERKNAELKKEVENDDDY